MKKNILEHFGMLEYSALARDAVAPSLLGECSMLFSQHYGKWRDSGKPVRLSTAQLEAGYIFDDRCKLYTARFQGQLIGYAFARHFETPGLGRVDWVTQLVVHGNYRAMGVGKRLCAMAFDISTAFACCLVSSHPYAVRILETVTQRYCDVARARENYGVVANASLIPYMQRAELARGTLGQVDTRFPVDHKDIQRLLKGIMDKQQRWELDDHLLDDHEFFACVFRDTPAEIMTRGGCISIVLADDEAVSRQLDEFARLHALSFTSTFSAYRDYHQRVLAALAQMKQNDETHTVLEVHDARQPSFKLKIRLIS